MTAGPLEGRRVVVTRRPDQSERLASALRAAGAIVIEVPLIEVVPPHDFGPLDNALRASDEYGWIAFTSANAVRSVADRLRVLARPFTFPRVASVGPATTHAIRKHLTPNVDLEPISDFRAEGLLAAFEHGDVKALRLLLPVSDRASERLGEGLTAQGARVHRVVAYRTIAPAEAGPALARALGDGVDAVAFASPSAVDGFAELAPGGGAGVRAAVIGPVTEVRARERGLDVIAKAEPSTADGLVAALVRALS
jgi:uroporphyrinogen III methyltransferase / synthase